VTNNPRPRQSPADHEMTSYVVSHEPGWNPHAPNPTSAASGLWRHIHRAHHGNDGQAA
jgi:hypothetical protein